MKRSSINFIVDVVAFSSFAFLIATGLLIRYVLPPGSGYHTTVSGLDRHEWGAIHFWIAIAFLAVLTLHVFLHWRWVTNVARGQRREGSGARLVLGLVGALAVLAFAFSPFSSSVEQIKTAPPQKNRAIASTPSHDMADIRGRMTLLEIEKRTGVPASYLVKHLPMPSNVSLATGVGRLGKWYGFDMDDVRRVVRDHGASN